jgi:hypothetical protein
LRFFGKQFLLLLIFLFLCPSSFDFFSPVQQNLRWGCDVKKADEICNHNRHYAEHSGYFESKTKFIPEAKAASSPIDFYDSNTRKLLFTAPVGRSMKDFLIESSAHGWPSFRDSEVRIICRTLFVLAIIFRKLDPYLFDFVFQVNWEFVRCLPNGETVSVDGTHLVSLQQHNVASLPLLFSKWTADPNN